jgi:hypothetical protein
VRLLDMKVDSNLLASSLLACRTASRANCVHRVQASHLPAPELVREFFAEVPAG